MYKGKGLPLLTGSYNKFSDIDRQIFSLPAKYGGLGIFNPVEICTTEYENPRLASKSLTLIVKSQLLTVIQDRYAAMTEERMTAKKHIAAKKKEQYQDKINRIKESCTDKMKRTLDLISEKGASLWLTSLPLQEHGFLLNKQEFVDALLLRYNFPLKEMPRNCACGKENSVDHALIC